MFYIRAEKDARLVSELGDPLFYRYMLICNMGVYNILCISVNDGTGKIYRGVSEDESTALRVFDIVYNNGVAPEHLDCIIDDILGEMN